MKVAIFNGADDTLEKTINDFFLKNPDIVLKNVTQSSYLESPVDVILVITIFYEEKPTA